MTSGGSAVVAVAAGSVGGTVAALPVVAVDSKAVAGSVADVTLVLAGTMRRALVAVAVAERLSTAPCRGLSSPPPINRMNASAPIARKKNPPPTSAFRFEVSASLDAMDRRAGAAPRPAP
jgi:hypothetical protein